MTDVLFNNSSAREHFMLDLQACYVSAPVRKSHVLSVPFGDGEIDAMEGKFPVYEHRILTLVFTMLSAKQAIGRILSELEGKKYQIITPDQPNYYWEGVIRVSSCGQRDGDTVTMMGNVFPWRMSLQTVSKTWGVHNDWAAGSLYNNGMRPVVPEMTVLDNPVTVKLPPQYTQRTFDPGIYLVSDYVIPPNGGRRGLLYMGGSLKFEYREAIL